MTDAYLEEVDSVIRRLRERILALETELAEERKLGRQREHEIDDCIEWHNIADDYKAERDVLKKVLGKPLYEATMKIDALKASLTSDRMMYESMLSESRARDTELERLQPHIRWELDMSAAEGCTFCQEFVGGRREKEEC